MADLGEEGGPKKDFSEGGHTKACAGRSSLMGGIEKIATIRITIIRTTRSISTDKDTIVIQILIMKPTKKNKRRRK